MQRSRVSWRLAAQRQAVRGDDEAVLVPSLPHSVGLWPVSAPPRLACTERLSTTTSQGSDPARTMRIRARRTRRK